MDGVHAAAGIARWDIRNGFKLAPVDYQPVPGRIGNNLSPTRCCWRCRRRRRRSKNLPRGAQSADRAGKTASIPASTWPACRTAGDLRMAGLNVRLSSTDLALKRSTTLTLPDGEKPTLEPAQRTGSFRLGLKHFDPCTILLSNDLSAPRASWKTCPSNTFAAAAGRLERATQEPPLPVLRRSEQALASCWGSIRGSSTRCSPPAARSTCTRPTAAIPAHPCRRC